MVCFHVPFGTVTLQSQVEACSSQLILDLSDLNFGLWMDHTRSAWPMLFWTAVLWGAVSLELSWLITLTRSRGHRCKMKFKRRSLLIAHVEKRKKLETNVCALCLGRSLAIFRKLPWHFSVNFNMIHLIIILIAYLILDIDKHVSLLYIIHYQYPYHVPLLIVPCTWR
jgi:hypothetical protein